MSHDRRVHRLSPLLRIWTTVLALVALAAFNFGAPLYRWLQHEQDAVGWAGAGWLFGAVLAMLLFIFAVSQLWWSRTSFRVGEEDLELRSGVLTKQMRSARYDRIQAVDIVEPLAARVLRLAGVRIEVAGGADAAIDISYLPRAEAEALREEILSRIATKEPQAEIAGEVAAHTDGNIAGATEPYVVPPIPIGRSLAATALQMSTLITVASTLVPLLTDLSLAAIAPIVIGALPQIWRTVDQSWRFNSTYHNDVFSLTYGLANRRRQAVPLDRIHAVQLKQPLLWRPFGWWMVSITSAGYGAEGSSATGTAKLLPVGTFAEAAKVIDAVSPLSAEQLMDATVPDYASPRRSRWVSPVDWRQQTASVSHGVAVVTFGRLTRRYQVVEVPHIQELSMHQGPLQRAMRLASVRYDLVPGLVKMTARDLDSADARDLVEALRARPLPPLQPLEPA